MHEHDDELIGALAEGALPAEEANRVEAEIAACDECRADLAAQRAALTAMSESPRPGLTALESARLRKSVAESVGIADAVVPERRRFLPWAGIATAAAVLVAIVIAAPLVNLLSTGEEDQVAEVAAAETTIAEAEATAPRADSDAGAADAPEPEEAATQAPESPALEEAAGDDLAQVAGDVESDGGLLALGPIALEDLEALHDTFPEQAGLEDGLELRAVTSDEVRVLEFGSVTPSPAGGQTVAPETCRAVIAEAVPDAALVVATATAEFDGSPVLVVAAFTSETGPPLILVIDEGNCVVVATVGS